MADDWAAFRVQPQESSSGDPWAAFREAPVTQKEEATPATTLSERAQKVWDHPTPGGPLWLLKQAVEGVKGSVDASTAAMSTPQTEGDAFQQNQGREQGPAYAMQAASVLGPGVPKGTGGMFAAPMAARPGPVGPRPTTPGVEQLEAAYRDVRNNPDVKNATVPIQDVESLAANAQTDLLERGNRPTPGSAPRTFAEVNRLTPKPPPELTPQQRLQAEMNWEPTPPAPRVTEAKVDDLLAAKRAFGNVAQERKPFPQQGATEDAGAASNVIGKLDDVIEQAAPGMKNANANYSAAQVAKSFDKRIQTAELSGDVNNSGMNIGNKIRQQAFQIWKNPSAQRGLKPEEVDAIKSIAEGSATRNTIRWFSNVFGGGGGLGAVVTGDVASRTLGPIGWALSPIGHVLKHLENHLTVKAANQVSEAIRLRSPLGKAIESSMNKWDEARRAALLAPSSAKMGVFSMASRNLANTLQGAGAKINPRDLLRSLQSPAGANADEQQVPGQVAQ